MGGRASEKVIMGYPWQSNGTTAQHDGDTYARKKEEARARNAKASRTERDISTGYPGPGNRYRRRKCAKSLESFLTSYFPDAFSACHFQPRPPAA